MEMGAGSLAEKKDKGLYATMRGGRIDPSSCLTTHFLDLDINYKAKRWEFSITTNNLIALQSLQTPLLGIAQQKILSYLCIIAKENRL